MWNVSVLAKTIVKRSVAVPVSAQKSPTMPVFITELYDLSVMDGSQITMTVEVTGNKRRRLHRPRFVTLVD